MTDLFKTSTISRATLVDIGAPDLGRALRGLGINLLVYDAAIYASRLAAVLGVDVIRSEKAFALVAIPTFKSTSDDIPVQHLIQIHADMTYVENPYQDLLPQGEPRGIGVELHLFETDPDVCAGRADADPNWTLLQPATDKPHGVREAYLLDDHGYCWVVSSPLF